MTTKAKLVDEGKAYFRSVLEANEDLAARLTQLSVTITGASARQGSRGHPV